MTSQERRRIHQQVELKRSRYLRIHTNNIGRALAMTMKEFQEAMTENALTPEQAIPMAETKLTDAHILLAVRNLYKDVFVEFAASTQRQVESQMKKAVDKTTFIIFLEGWFEKTAVGRIQNISKTMRKDTVRVLQAAVNEGLGIADTVRLFQERRIGYEPSRAARIARTEIVSASNYGAKKGAEETGLAVKKEWIATNDPRTRRIRSGDEYDHDFMDGVIKQMDEPFMVPKSDGTLEPMDVPGDLNGSPGNVINCRCTVGFIPAED